MWPLLLKLLFFVKHKSFSSTVLKVRLLVKDGYEALSFLLHFKIKMRNYFTVLLRGILAGKFESKKVYFMLLSDFKCLSKLQKQKLRNILYLYTSFCTKTCKSGPCFFSAEILSICKLWGGLTWSVGIVLYNSLKGKIFTRRIKEECEYGRTQFQYFLSSFQKTIAKIATCLELRSAALQV